MKLKELGKPAFSSWTGLRDSTPAPHQGWAHPLPHQHLLLAWESEACVCSPNTGEFCLPPWVLLLAPTTKHTWALTHSCAITHITSMGNKLILPQKHPESPLTTGWENTPLAHVSQVLSVCEHYAARPVLSPWSLAWTIQGKYYHTCCVHGNWCGHS